MKVSELIAILQTMPQDAKVMITDCELGNKWDNEVRDVVDNSRGGKLVDNTVELDNWPAEDF